MDFHHICDHQCGIVANMLGLGYDLCMGLWPPRINDFGLGLEFSLGGWVWFCGSGFLVGEKPGLQSGLNVFIFFSSGLNLCSWFWV